MKVLSAVAQCTQLRHCAEHVQRPGPVDALTVPDKNEAEREARRDKLARVEQERNRNEQEHVHLTSWRTG
jgi:hypothetical protein